jgi:hypothetical protein
MDVWLKKVEKKAMSDEGEAWLIVRSLIDGLVRRVASHTVLCALKATLLSKQIESVNLRF